MNRLPLFIIPLLFTLLLAGCEGDPADRETREVDPVRHSVPSPGIESDTGVNASDAYETALPDTVKINRPWNEARQRGAEFRATGNEPGWYLEIFEGDSIVLVADYGERRVVTPAQEPFRADSLTAYRVRTDTLDLGVMIDPWACTDSMNGMLFESTVTVVLNGHTYRGCGRNL